MKNNHKYLIKCVNISRLMRLSVFGVGYKYKEINCDRLPWRLHHLEILQIFGQR